MPRMTKTAVAAMVVTALVMSSAAESGGSDRNLMCVLHGDGCSIPLDLPFLYKTTFTPFCHRHDVCYGCGAAYGLSKEDCDAAFLQDMTSACHEARRRRLTRDRRNFCTSVAKNLYYAAVHWFASSHFHTEDRLERHCAEDWILNCLPSKQR